MSHMTTYKAQACGDTLRLEVPIDVEGLRVQANASMPASQIQTNEILISYISNSSNINFDFRLCEFQLYSHTLYLDIASTYQDVI